LASHCTWQRSAAASGEAEARGIDGKAVIAAMPLDKSWTWGKGRRRRPNTRDGWPLLDNRRWRDAHASAGEEALDDTAPHADFLVRRG
jgi:hypothetical protein